MRDNDSLTLLLDVVADMRHFQKEYFRTRSPAALSAAKREETRVDKLLDELRRPSLLDGI